MAQLLQLDFFEDTEITHIKQEIEKVKQSSDRVRKGMYAKHGALEKKFQELDDRLGIIERNICKNK